MWKHFYVILIILKIFHLSVQQTCEFSCLSDDTSDKNCVYKNNITANAEVNATNGIVDFQFDFGCNVSIYTILIFYDEDNCNESRHLFTYTYKKISKFDETNMDYIKKCTNKGNVLFHDIQSGCYKIQILDNLKIIYENNSDWQTFYKRSDLDLNDTDTVHSSRNNGTELLFCIKNPILNFHPEFALDFECDHCSKNFTDPTYNLILDKNNPEKLILNPKDNNTHLNISCNLERNETESRTDAVCFISPVSVGHYSIVITFVGDTCRKYNRKIIKFGNIEVTHLHQQSDAKESIKIFEPLLGVICTIFLVLIVYLIIKLTKAKLQKDNQNKNDTLFHDFNASCENETKPKILLLYARNSENVMTTLSSFRNIFKHQGIQIYDIYDPDNLREIYENDCDWIVNLIGRKDIKIILFLTPSAKNSSELPQMQSSIDHIYPFAVKHLICRISRDSEFYKKICVAHFSNDVYEYSDYDLFSPNLRFRIPDDFFDLFQRILNTRRIISLNNTSNNEFNRLRENYEKYICVQENITNYI